MAATRISEGFSSFVLPHTHFLPRKPGFVQQWGSVTRKKDKKPPAVSHPQTKESSSGTSDFRGRGGRVGRVGPGRGGSGGSRPRGTSRGGHPGANGHFSRPSNSPGLSPSAGWADPTATPDDPDKVSVGDGGTWSNKQDAVTATWNDPPSQETPTWVTPNWGETGIDGSPSLASKPPSKPPKNPATSKLSWAQVARYVHALVTLFEYLTCRFKTSRETHRSFSCSGPRHRLSPIPCVTTATRPPASTRI